MRGYMPDSEKQAVAADAKEWDATKGETPDSSSKVSAAGHDARNHMQDEAAKGDDFSKNLTKDWERDRSKK